jgi:carboxymethylenebutenolidase
MADGRQFRGRGEPASTTPRSPTPSGAPKRPRRGTTRRNLIAAALGSGFALAVRPVSADTITTSSDGLDVADVSIPTSAGEIPGYRAMPASKGKGKKSSVILVVMEIFGLHEHIKDVCRRLAKKGYFAVAPDLMARQGDVMKLSDIEAVKAVANKVPDAQVKSDLDATVEWAKKSDGADTDKLGITGFCRGGRTTWLYAAHNTKLKAGVAWYGKLAGDRDELRPRQPVDIAGILAAPVLGLYGEKDEGIPLDTIDAMKKALAAGSGAAKKSQIRVYPKAGHAFLADYRPSYEPVSAADGWRRMLAWFKANGVP